MRKFSRYSLLLPDFVAAALAWMGLFVFRKIIIEQNEWASLDFAGDEKFYYGSLLLPLFWVLLHWLVGTYTDVYRKSRLTELVRTTVVSFAGTVVVFFALLLDDLVTGYRDYYLTFLMLFALQTLFTFLGRYTLITRAKRHFRKNIFRFPTLIIGNSTKADEVFHELTEEQKFPLNHFVGYIETHEGGNTRVMSNMQCLGELQDLEKVMDAHHIEEVIVAVETSQHHLLSDIINRLGDRNVFIKIVPDMYDILSGLVRMNHVVGDAFIEIPPQLVQEWQRITKRIFDITASGIALLVLGLPMLLIALRIKWESAGDALYRQERLGQFGKPFLMLKFRSMRQDAENGKPQLTRDDDERITRTGKWLRKYRIDELPQFINVLKGEMSIVGPRAERRFFADQIIAKAPYYRHVFKVKPGITSLGMVKYGYASSVEQMIKRLKYDIIYMENISLLTDLKIMVYTVLTVLYGRGK